jgi:hypothetical protein
MAAKPAPTAPPGVKPSAALPAKPVAAKGPMPGRSPTKPPVPEFDQSDVSEPDMSPSQFFRVFDAKLDK